MNEECIVNTTSCSIEDFEQLAVAIPMKRTPAERRNAAVLLREELSAAFGNSITTVSVGEDSCRTYDPDEVTMAIDKVKAYMAEHPQATEYQIAEELRNPVAGLYSSYIEQCDWDLKAEALTRATLMYNYALSQAREALLAASYAEGKTKPQQNDNSASGSMFPVDSRLQTDEAKRLLAILENVKVQVARKGELQALNTKTTPWSYASKGTLRYIAKCAGNILNIHDKWHVFELAAGAKNLQQSNGKEPIEVSNALKKAQYKDFDR